MRGGSPPTNHLNWEVRALGLASIVSMHASTDENNEDEFWFCRIPTKMSRLHIDTIQSVSVHTPVQLCTIDCTQFIRPRQLSGPGNGTMPFAP